jgi:hypothetical protein
VSGVHGRDAGVHAIAQSVAWLPARVCSYSSRGPAQDQRTKPDISGPTGVETAYTATSPNVLSYFSGTSAATPNAAGKAMAAWAWQLFLHAWAALHVGAAWTAGDTQRARLLNTHLPAWLPAGAFGAFYMFRMARPGLGGTTPQRGEWMASIIAAGENYGLPNNDHGAGPYRPGVLTNVTVGNNASNTWGTRTFTS